MRCTRCNARFRDLGVRGFAPVDIGGCDCNDKVMARPPYGALAIAGSAGVYEGAGIGDDIGAAIKKVIATISGFLSEAHGSPGTSAERSGLEGHKVKTRKWANGKEIDPDPDTQLYKPHQGPGMTVWL